MKYRMAIFDFDGTLADSFPFFAQVFNQLAEQHGFKRIDPDLAPTFRHYNARQIMKQVGMPDWKLPFVVKSFTSLMRQNAASISLFEHVDDLLLHLANKGVTLAIVSSNSYDNVSQILGPANIKLISQFECGMSMFGKLARIQKVLRKTGIPCHEAISIGDQGEGKKGSGVLIPHKSSRKYFQSLAPLYSLPSASFAAECSASQ